MESDSCTNHIDESGSTLFLVVVKSHNPVQSFHSYIKETLLIDVYNDNMWHYEKKVSIQVRRKIHGSR